MVWQLRQIPAIQAVWIQFPVLARTKIVVRPHFQTGQISKLVYKARYFEGLHEQVKYPIRSVNVLACWTFKQIDVNISIYYRQLQRVSADYLIRFRFRCRFKFAQGSWQHIYSSCEQCVLQNSWFSVCVVLTLSEEILQKIVVVITFYYFIDPPRHSE